MSCWDQFVTMLFGHLAKAKSLREIIGGMASQESFLYHLGAKLIKPSSLSYANAHRPWKIYRDVFYQFLTQCRFFQTQSGETAVHPSHDYGINPKNSKDKILSAPLIFSLTSPTI